MTDKEKLEKLMKLADAMYYAAQNLTTDASRLHKAMDEYHKFIIYECKEEPVSEDFETALEKKVREAQDWTYIEEEGGECPLNEEFGTDDLEEFARWGADWVQNNKKEPVSNELTDEIKSWFKQWSENEMEWSREDIWDTAEHFANWQKEQLMKGAEECYIRRNRYTKKNVLNGFDVTCDAIQRFKGGDKVKIIILKE